ncbi:unnamed protein product [Closterium sp. NIES-53]
MRRPPGFTGSFPPGTQWSLRRPVYGLRQAPREWHDTLRTTLVALGFAPSTADPSLFLRTDTSLPPFYVLVYVDDLVFATADTAGLAHRTITLTQSHMVQQVLQLFDFTYSSPQATPLSTRHSLSALPSDESVEPSGPYPELVGCLITSGMGLVLGGRRPVVLTGHADASWADDQATQRSYRGYTFSLGSGSVSWRSTRSSSVLSSSCEAEIYAGAMAAQELRWVTYLLTDLGEQPRSPPVLYVDNKAMLALCREHRLEHRTKHIALLYFLARELQQRGQLRLAYVASKANTADIFTKALAPGDHQRFCTRRHNRNLRCIRSASTGATTSSARSFISSRYTKQDTSILARDVAPGRHRPEHMAAAKRVLRYLCSTSGMGLVLGGRRPVVLTGHTNASWADDQATQRSSCEAEIYAGAMAAQELRWLTYLLIDLGEQPRSPPVLYVDNKAMLALCREHRLEHRTKHIALRYFLARELQQRGQLRLAYMASEANTADIFTKALAPGDHQHFCTMLGLVPTWPHLLTS